MNIMLTDASDIYAGGEEYVLTLATNLARRGHTVGVSARPGHLLLDKCASANLPVHPIPYGDMSRVFALSRDLGRTLREHSIDVVHSNANYDRTCAAFATFRLTTRHVAGIHSTHSIQHNITHRIRNAWFTSHFITDADAGRDVLLSHDRIPAARVTTIPIGIDADPVEQQRTYRSTTRAALGIDPETLVVGNVARLVPFKGHRYLLDAMKKLLAKIPSALLLIVGDGELEPELRGQAMQLGINASVRFLGFRDDLDRLYPAFDIYCHSSIDLASEMFPIAILHALGSGLPVVSSNVGGIGAMVDEGRSGYLVPERDPSLLAQRLLDLLEDSARRVSFAGASRALFERSYKASVMAERIEHIYVRACQRHKEPS
jgi:glycosyltransferase involved in cell wall biosynthesis